MIWLEAWEPGVVDYAACSFLLSFLRPFKRDECCITPSRDECPYDGVVYCCATYYRDAHVVELWCPLAPVVTMFEALLVVLETLFTPFVLRLPFVTPA